MESELRRWGFGPFVLDLRRGQLLHDGAVQVLTPQARRLLAVLVEAPGVLLHKDRLLAAAWPDAVVGEAALSVCIAELRRVLGDSARAPRFIETAHREGYRFVAPVAPAPEEPQRAAGGPSWPSLAVMPVRISRRSRLDMGLADGLREELVDRALRWNQHPILAPEGLEPGTARYRLDTLVQREGRRVRASSRLGDCALGHVVWSQRIDCVLEDPLDAQAALGRGFIQSLRVGFAFGVEAQLATAPSLAPWEALARAQALRLRQTPALAAQAQAVLEAAVARSPDSAALRAALGSVLFDLAWNDWRPDGAAVRRGLLACAERAVALDPGHAEALALRGLALALNGCPAHARESAELACAADPLEPRARTVRGFLTVLHGDPDEGLDDLLEGQRLGPYDAYRFAAWASAALAHFAAGRDAQAVSMAQRANAVHPRWEADCVLVAALVRMGRRQDAVPALRRLRAVPAAREHLGAALAASGPVFLEPLLEALRTADRRALPGAC
jgi:DNA-binding winged helix-turn-helix (wHTH) protein/tetratricopeptide (TPR) repeat protein